MKRTVVAIWSSDKGIRHLLLLAGIVLLLAGGSYGLGDDESSIISRSEIEELERERERMDEELEVDLKTGGAISCGDNYCNGLYDDLIAYTFLRHDGFAGVRIHPDVEPFLAASSLNCATTTTIYTQRGNEGSAIMRETVTEWMAQLKVARAMGYEVQLRWKQSNFPGWLVCNMEYVYTLDPPAS